MKNSELKNLDLTTAEGRDKLGMELARRTQEKPWKHGWQYTGSWHKCSKCKTSFGGVKSVAPCPVPDPIDVNDMGLAVKMFREQCLVPDGEEIEVSDCRYCNDSYTVPYGLEDTGLCNTCAQDIATSATAPEIMLIVALAKGEQE